MKTKYHPSPGKRLLPGSIFTQLYSYFAFKDSFNKIYTDTVLYYAWFLAFGNQQAANKINNLILITTSNISETETYFIKKSLCH